MPAARLAGQYGVAARMLQRWAARYRTDGLAGLARCERADRGARRFPAELPLLIEGLALKRPPPSIATIHRDVIAVAQEHGWPVPSYATVHDVVRHLDPALAVLAHEGTLGMGLVGALKDAYLPGTVSSPLVVAVDVWDATSRQWTFKATDRALDIGAGDPSEHNVRFSGTGRSWRELVYRRKNRRPAHCGWLCNGRRSEGSALGLSGLPGHLAVPAA